MSKRRIVTGGLIVLAGAGLTVGLVACKPKAKFDNEDSKAAYIIGYKSGEAAAQQAPKLNTESYMAGFQDAFAKKPAPMNEEEMKTVLTAFAKRLQDDALTKVRQEGAAKEASNTAFLTANGKKPGVTTTASGLQYEVISQGKGPKPAASDMVRVHYEGKLLDGTVFDSSISRGQPVEFPLNGVIPGWTEGVQLMGVGSKYRFTIPAKLAYGENGMPPAIPPNSVLQFEVELLDIVK